MMPPMDMLLGRPHRRHDPLRDEWVLVSPNRSDRPWAGAVEAPAVIASAAYDPACYLCPANARANGDTNPAYDSTFVFTNDFAALIPGSSAAPVDDGLLRAVGESGTCRVVCFSPRHDLSLGSMSGAQVRRVIDTWADHTSELGRVFAWVQVFENRGSGMGASNPHPHGQIWASANVPGEPARESATQANHFATHGRRLLSDYSAQERGGPRVVVENDDWLVVVPFWAVWPFETLVLPKTPAARLADLGDAARDSLSVAMIDLLGHYDRLFGVPFPYSMGWHQAPFDGSPTEPWLLHAHYYPPLLRSASVRKFMVGYELLAEPQRDMTPEEAAERLRAA
jgi:UDPglucose--hexose-1-phosphate uridylyltransferase